MIQERTLTPAETRTRYYLSSGMTLLSSVRPIGLLVRLLSGRRSTDAIVRLPRTGLRFAVRNAMDLWILKEVCVDREYDVASGGLENGWTVLDVGAGFGAFAVHVAATRPQSNVYAFEPSPQSFALLQRNLQLNGVGNVQVFDRAVGRANGSAWLRVSDGEPLTSALTTGPVQGSVAVEQWTLGEALDRIGVARCDFLKMDCEGSEFDILRSTPGDVLARVDRMCFEYHDDAGRHHAELVDILTRAGFVVRAMPGPAYRERGLIYACRGVS